MAGSVFCDIDSQSFASTILAGLPVLLRTLMVTGLTVALLTYVIMPRLTQLFRKWLYPVS